MTQNGAGEGRLQERSKVVFEINIYDWCRNYNAHNDLH